MNTWDHFVQLIKTQFEPMVGRFGFRRLMGYEGGYADESGVVLYYENDDPLRIVIDNLRQMRYDRGHVKQFYWIRVKVGRQNLKHWQNNNVRTDETGEGWVYSDDAELPNIFQELMTTLENYLAMIGRQSSNHLTWFYHLIQEKLDPYLHHMGFQLVVTGDAPEDLPTGEVNVQLIYRHTQGYEVGIDMVKRSKKENNQRVEFLWLQVKVGGDYLKKWLYPQLNGDMYDTIGWKHYEEQPFEEVLAEIQQGLAQYFAAYRAIP